MKNVKFSIARLAVIRTAYILYYTTLNVDTSCRYFPQSKKLLFIFFFVNSAHKHCLFVKDPYFINTIICVIYVCYKGFNFCKNMISSLFNYSTKAWDFVYTSKRGSQSSKKRLLKSTKSLSYAEDIL